MGMIDKNTGELVLDAGLRIPPFCAKEALLASPLGQGAVEKNKGPGWTDVKVPPQRIDGRDFLVIFHFHEGLLAGLHLMDDDPRYGTSFETADEAGRKVAHDAWLAETLGRPPYTYAWGEVGSTYDPRSDSSEVYVRYRDQEA
jgi:hypothetical protein